MKKRLPYSRKLHDLPALEARQKRLTQIFKLVARVADFGSQKTNVDKIAIRDLQLAAGIFSEPTANVHSERDDTSFVQRWFRQAKAIQTIVEAALKYPVDPTRGIEIPPFQQTLVARILPSLFRKVFGRRLPITRGGVGIQFIGCCLRTLGEPVPPEETVVAWLLAARGPSAARSVKTRSE
jgi:hypothetical protein